MFIIGGVPFHTKKTKSKILLCACGGKYIKTRRAQKVCVFCINKGDALQASLPQSHAQLSQ